MKLCHDHLFAYFSFTTNISPLSPSPPSLPICYSPFSFHLHLFSSRLPASEAKLHLINNGCCCLLHCWRRAGTLGNAGATFNWMGLLMHPAGGAPSQCLPPLAAHIRMHTSPVMQCNFPHRGRSWRSSSGSVCGSDHVSEAPGWDHSRSQFV